MENGTNGKRKENGDKNAGQVRFAGDSKGLFLLPANGRYGGDAKRT